MLQRSFLQPTGLLEPVPGFSAALLGLLLFGIWASIALQTQDWFDESQSAYMGRALFIGFTVIQMVISMFMAPGQYTEHDRIFPGQEYVQLLLMACAVVAVPFLLIPKPLLYYLDMTYHKLKLEHRVRVLLII